MKRLAVGLVLLIVGITACSPSNVEASQYDQSCAQDDDCVQVSELQTRGNDCIFGCGGTAINKKDKAQFDEDFAAEERHCRGKAAPFCDLSGVAKCVQSRCVVKPQ